MGHPWDICRSNQRRVWHIVFCFCPVILQKKAQAQQTREFHKKSIKEKAVHLSGLFTGDGPAEVKVTAGSVIPPPRRWPPQQHAHLHVEHTPCGTHLVLPVIWSLSSTTFRHPELRQCSGAWVCVARPTFLLIGPTLDLCLLFDNFHQIWRTTVDS